MDKRIERALNYPACVKPLHKAGWRENGTSIRCFTGEFTEYKKLGKGSTTPPPEKELVNE